VRRLAKGCVIALGVCGLVVGVRSLSSAWAANSADAAFGAKEDPQLSFGFASGGGFGCGPSACGSSASRSPVQTRPGDLFKSRSPQLRGNVWRYGPFGRFGLVQPGLLLDILDDIDLRSIREEMRTVAKQRQDARAAYLEELSRMREEEIRRRLGRQASDAAPEGFAAPRRTQQPDQMRPPTAASSSSSSTPSSALSPLSSASSENLMVPSLRMSEGEAAYNYRLDVQGMDRDDLKLTLQDNIVVVEGNKMVQTDDGYHSSSFKRSFTLPPDADLDTVRSQEISEGELVLTADKLKPATHHGVREIKIERLPATTSPQVPRPSAQQAPPAPQQQPRKSAEDGADAIARAIGGNNGKKPNNDHHGANNNPDDGLDDGVVSDSY